MKISCPAIKELGWLKVRLVFATSRNVRSGPPVVMMRGIKNDFILLVEIKQRSRWNCRPSMKEVVAVLFKTEVFESGQQLLEMALAP